MVVSRSGALKSARFYPAVMRSAARLTYTLANDALFAGRPAARSELGPLLERLMVLVDVYRALYKARGHRGALDFDAAEAEFVIDAGERVRAIELRVRNDAHRLIEECMILANVAVAEALEKAHTPTLYRVHGQPEDEKLERLAATLTALGIDARIPKTVTTRDLQAIARRVGNAPERAFVESLVIRSMPQAVYQPANIGHFGLALTHYAHFTSPIRRYPDLVVHRTLKALIGAQGGSGVRYATAELSALGESTSRLEKRADEADRYVSGFLKCTYLKERIGQTFQGLITTVVEFGCFVQILDVAVDIRRSSATFGRHVSAIISAENWKQIFVPIGFAHGFVTLEANTQVFYKVSDYYSPQHERGILWNDPALKIDWGVGLEETILSQRDTQHPVLARANDLF